MTECAHLGDNAKKALARFVERIESLENEKKALADDIRDVYAETKSAGLEPKMIRRIVSMRKIDTKKRQDEEAVFEVYLLAMGML